MGHKKTNLPHKTCAACQRPFYWRKKWARNWEAVKYCSRACAAGLKTVKVPDDRFSKPGKA